MIQTRPHHYSDGETTFIGSLSYDDASPGPRPGVLIAPAFGGLGPLEIARAQDLARQGYVALAVDYYGDGKRANDEAEASALMRALNADRPLMARRMICALEVLKLLEGVDPGKIGAMGYCFGGKCVLDLARSGAEFQAVAPLHGVYDAPEMTAPHMVPAALILHGWDDPLSPPEAVLTLTKELTATCDDWQLLAFGHTGHAFTNPSAKAPAKGLAFNEDANRRSWAALLAFFAEKLGGA